MKTLIELAKAVDYPLLRFEGVPHISPELKRLVAAAVAQERELCAQVCEDHFSSDGDWCSRVIRARGTHENCS